MKIEINSVTSKNRIKLRKPSSKSSSSFFDGVYFNSENSTLNEFLGLSALFQLQENPSLYDPLAKADDLLNILDRLRMEMLVGRINVEDLRNINTLAQNLHNSTQNKYVRDLLREIETRAMIELAKRSLDF